MLATTARAFMDRAWAECRAHPRMTFLSSPEATRGFFCVGPCRPEAAVGVPIAHVRDGDPSRSIP